jgi:hypothetical protein
MLFSAKIKDLEAQVSALTTERDEALAANGDCQARFTADQATIAALTGERDAALASVATLTTERDAAIAERDEAKATVGTKVVERLASAGVAPVAQDAKATNATTVDGTLSAQLEAIKDPGQRTAFVRKHKAALFAEANAAKLTA